MVDRIRVSLLISSFNAYVIPMKADRVLIVNVKSRQIEFRFADLNNKINDDSH